MLRRIFAIAGVFLATACGSGDRLDGSSAETFKHSVEEMEAKLSPKERQEFFMALLASNIRRDERGRTMMGNGEMMRKELNGRTVREIIITTYVAQLATYDKRLAALQAEIDAFEADLALAEATIEASRITGAKYSWISDTEPVIEFSVTNGGATAMSRLYFEGVLKMPGRVVPVVSDQLSYSPPGGLAPGETRKLYLRPNPFGVWADARLRQRDDLEFMVELVNYDGPTGEKQIKASPEEIGKMRRKLRKLLADRDELFLKAKKYREEKITPAAAAGT